MCLVEVVLDAEVILHGGLVLEEPMAELAGRAAGLPVLIPAGAGLVHLLTKVPVRTTGTFYK